MAALPAQASQLTAVLFAMLRVQLRLFKDEKLTPVINFYDLKSRDT